MLFIAFNTFDSADDNDNEEIGELSRLQDPNNQDPASQDIPNQDLDTNTDQVGGSINGADVEKINPTVDNGLVPSDQNQSTSDSLANISDFLKNKEGEGPGRQVQLLAFQLIVVKPKPKHLQWPITTKLNSTMNQ